MRRRKQRGITLVIVVGVIAALVVVVASIAAEVSLYADVRVNRLASKRARLVANSGVQYGFSVLQGQSATSASQTDNWATIGGSSFTSPADIVYQVNDGYFRIQIVDGCSLINVNTASNAQLLDLPLTQEQVDSLLDWRSAGETARDDGAKDSFYNSLTQPYNAKLGPLDTVDELLQIEYFTRDTIYDIPTVQSTSQTATGNNNLQQPLASILTVDSTSPLPAPTGKINVSVAGGNVQQLSLQLVQAGLPVNIVTLILQGRPFRTYGALLRLQGLTTAQAVVILNRLSVGGALTATNRINVNTASQTVLQTLPGMTPDVASAIVSRQSTPFTSLGDVLSVPGVTVTSAASFIDSITVASSTFLIRVIGWVGNTAQALEATVSVTGGTPKILKIVDQPFPNMDVRWNWADAATTNTLVDPSTVKSQ